MILKSVRGEFKMSFERIPGKNIWEFPFLDLRLSDKFSIPWQQFIAQTLFQIMSYF
jgi:hypothetical protein